MKSINDYKLLNGLFIFLFLPGLFSCSKPANNNGTNPIDNPPIVNDSTGVIYYDYYALDNLPQFATTFENYRVCYDMNKRLLRWKKKNEFSVPYYFPNIGTTPQTPSYSKAFLQSGSLFKIFPSSESLSGAVSGIYFQKINTVTGEPSISKKIIDATDLNLSTVFTISEVVTDGLYFYFSCNNGFVYCFDSSGNQVWKKGSYIFKRTSYNQSAFFYYNDNRLYFYAQATVSGPLFLVCLEALAGSLVWTTPALNYTGFQRETLFSKNHVVNFNDGVDGRVYIIQKSDGQKVGELSEPPVSQYRAVIPIGAISDNVVAYCDRTGRIQHLDVTQPGIINTINGAEAASTYNSQLYKESLYNVASNTLTITLYRANPNTGITWTNAMQISPTSNPQFIKAKYTLANDKLYTLSTGRFESNFWLANSPVDTKMQLSVSIFNINSGNFLKQYNNLPAGLAPSHSMGIYSSDYHFLYNIVVTE